MKINNLTELKAEKILLQEQAQNISTAMQMDFDQIKRSIQPRVLLHRAIDAMIPESLKNAKITGVPINFILKALFKNNLILAKPDPIEGKTNQAKNIALSVLESAAMVLLKHKMNRKS